jgi:crossover junction endodeoxyribonuclease RusA
VIPEPSTGDQLPLQVDTSPDSPDTAPDPAIGWRKIERPDGPAFYTIAVPLWRNKPPLSANQRLHWRQKAERTGNVRTKVRLLAKQARIPAAARLTVQLHYLPGDGRRRDAPNLVATSKPAIDGLVDAGLVPDDNDRYVIEIMPKIHPGHGKRRLWLTVQPHQ